MSDHRRLALLSTCAVVLAGCATAAQPRNAQVAPPGHIAGDFYLPVTTVGHGEARGTLTRVSNPEAPPDEQMSTTGPIAIDGNSGALLIGHPLLYVMPAWFDLNLRVGVFEPCEIGSLLSWVRVGGEVRCGLAQERWGAPLSVAASAGAAWHPFFQKSEPWYRSGLDISRWLGWGHVSVGIYLSYGPEERGMLGVPSGLDRMEDLHVGPSVQVSSRELRLSVPVGLDIRPEDWAGITVGLVPRFDLLHDDLDIECRQCAPVLTEFEEDWAVTATVGMAFDSLENVFADWGRPSPPEQPLVVPPGHHVEYHYRDDLLGATTSTLLTGYLIMGFPLLLSGDEVDVPATTWIPVVGPWILATTDEQEIGGDGIHRVFGIIGGVIQTMGASLLLWWALDPDEVVVPDEPG